MPKKNKKHKAPTETKVSDKNEPENVNPPKGPELDSKMDAVGEKPEKKSFCLSLDKKLKVQLKKQKKKQKKKEFEAEKKKIVEELSLISSIQWESAEELQPVETAHAILDESTVQVIKVEVLDEPNVNIEGLEMSEEDEKNLREFLKTLEISHGPEKVDVQPTENKFQIETIPEDLFEEFIQNEEMVQSKETIRTFPRTSPKVSPRHSPQLRKKNPAMDTPVEPSPRILYNYCGVSVAEPEKKTNLEKDSEDGVVVVRAFRSPNPEAFFNRRLDVILEETSDFSDASGHSDKKTKLSRESDSDSQHQPMLVKIFSLNKKLKEGAISDAAAGGFPCSVQPVFVETVQMSTDVVKIDLVESESEGDFEINQSETSNEASEIEVLNLEDDEGNRAKTIDNNFTSECGDNTTWSIESVSSVSSVKLTGEECESWRSSLNPEVCDGAEADVESELDSQRTVVASDADDELSLNMSYLLEIRDSIKDDFSRSSAKASNGASKCVSMDSDNLEEIATCEPDVEGLFAKIFFSNENKFGKKSEDVLVQKGFDFVKIETPSSNVNVKKMATAMKDDMDKILKAKIKDMQHRKDANFGDSPLIDVKQIEKNSSDSGTDTTTNKPQASDSSSYENVIRREKKMNVVSAAPEKTQTPEALSNLAEKKVLSMPYGRLVLRKIGLGRCCARDSDSGKDTDGDAYAKSRHAGGKATVGGSSSSEATPLNSFANKKITEEEEEEEEEKEEENPKVGKTYIQFNYSDPKMGQKETWYGMPTAVPAILVGFSPSQLKIYEEKSNKNLPDEAEAAKLLDLHKKFIERRSYYDTDPRNLDKYFVLAPNSTSSRVKLTEISKGIKIVEPNKKRASESQNRVGSEMAKEEKLDEKHMLSQNKSGARPKSPMTRSVGNVKLESKDGLVESKRYGEKSFRKESRDCKAYEKRGDRRKQTVSESKAVGNSRLLAILQNAISDEFAPDLNSDSYIEVDRENHEVSTSAMKEKENEVGSAAKGAEDDSQLKGLKSFQDLWNKEKNYCSTKSEGGGGSNTRQHFRPKTICCQDETELYVNEPKFVKEIRAPRTTTKFDNANSTEKEELIITQNLPAVSDVIKSFENPRVGKQPAKNAENAARGRQIQIDNERYRISKRGDIAVIRSDASERLKIQREKRKSMPASILTEQEVFKQKMYDEYMSKLAERIERRQQKKIRMSQPNEIECPGDGKFWDLENEFISKVKEWKGKVSDLGDGKRDSGEYSLEEAEEDLGRKCLEFASYWEEETSNLESAEDADKDAASSKRSSIQLLDPKSDVAGLPKHLKEFLQLEGEDFIGKLTETMPSTVVFSPTFKATAPRPGVWSPAYKSSSEERAEAREESQERKKLEDEPIPPVWTPKSAQASPVLERKEFRPVNFESPTLPRKKYIQDDKRESSVPPPWKQPGGDKPPELAKSPSSPALSLPKAPNPTVTLLQKAREGQLPKGAHYLRSDMSASPGPDDIIIERIERVTSTRSESERPRRAEPGAKKIIGIGPTTKEGIPLVLRSEVTDENKEKWYKRMYDSLHKYGKDDDYVTVKYRTSPSRKGLYGYQYGSSSGYQSEPEGLGYSRSTNKYVTLDRRREEKNKENECISVTLPRSRASPPKRDLNVYKNQPGRIEDYEPGHSSISELEANKWWDEVLEIFDKWMESSPEARTLCSKFIVEAIHSRTGEEKSKPIRKVQSPRSFTNYASGYISDPQYVYKRSEDELQSPPSSEEQKEAYRIIQKGGEIPLKGLRKPAPERPKDILDSEIEYFPLSPTLTRIRVHKQNITPLSELPLLPFSQHHATLNYPTLPFGVCSSYSQVQIFSPFATWQQNPQPVSFYPDPNTNTHKFAVQLQNISGRDDYVQIVPKPRTQVKKSPIYANIPPKKSSTVDLQSSRKKENFPCSEQSEILLPGKSLSSSKSSAIPVRIVSRERNTCEQSRQPVKVATFSDLKRVAPSINSPSVCLGKTPSKLKQKNSTTASEAPKESSEVRKLTGTSILENSSVSSKESELFAKKALAKRKLETAKAAKDKSLKKEKKKVLTENKEDSEVKVKKTKIPLSESLHREKPLLKTSRHLKSLSDNLKRKKKIEANKSSIVGLQKDSTPEVSAKKNLIGYLPRIVEYETEASCVDLKDETEKDRVKNTEREEVAMNYSQELLDFTPKPKIEADMTEVFRSRSFSPDVKRKISKPPDMNKPVPPKRRPSKSSSTLKMWSKMMVSYPGHKSRLDVFDSNVKYLGDRIKRKLADKKETKSEFGDDVETVRTIKKDKNGAMSIKTDRYVRLTRPAPSSLPSGRSTYPEIGRRKLLSDTRSKSFSANPLRPNPSLIRPTSTPKIPLAQKAPDTLVKSSTVYSLRKNEGKEDDKKKSVKVTVAISSKGKELLRKTTGVTSPVKKSTASKSSSSPCPSISSYRSGLSGKSPVSDKGSSGSSRERMQTPQTRLLSPSSSVSRLSSPRSPSPASAVLSRRTSKLTSKKPSALPVLPTYGEAKAKSEPKKPTADPSSKTSTSAKYLGKRLSSQVTALGKSAGSREEMKKKAKKNGKAESGSSGKLKRTGSESVKSAVRREVKAKEPQEPKNEVIEGRDLVRSDSFFQNLFLGSPVSERRAVALERVSSVVDRARRYQRKINWPDAYKSEPALVTFYLNQKRPVTCSKFRNMERELSSSRSLSPSGSLHSENFQVKLRRFDSMSQFGDFRDHLYRDLSPEAKERSSSEPPLRRSPESSGGKPSRISLSDASSMRSSPSNSSRSPSCRRIQSFKSSTKALERLRESKRLTPRARSTGELEVSKSKADLLGGDLGKSSSSLNLSNLSDHTEYQAYVLELMHSSRKCERFRELHKFYSSLERMGNLEKTASTGDLRPRLRNEEIIDFDRWKKIRTKERAEAELKTLVESLVKVQKEKDLLFRAADVEAVRWKGDSGLRIKERSVEDLKEQFNKSSQENLEPSICWEKDTEAGKDRYKSLWKGNSILDVARTLDGTLASHRGRPVTVEELEKIEKAKTRIGKEYGYSLKAWSSLSNEQVNALKDHLNEIYGEETRRQCSDGSWEDLREKYEISVPRDSGVRSPGESSLQVRCSSALSKSQTYTPTLKRKEELWKTWKKADSISNLTSGGRTSLPQLPWKDQEEPPKLTRSHSEGRHSRSDRYPVVRSKSTSSKPLTENEKKRLSMTLSREVIEKMAKASGKGPQFPRETLGALAAAGSNLRRSGPHGTCEGGFLALPPSKEKESSSEALILPKVSTNGLESGSGSSETSTKTVIRKNSMDVLRKVQYFEELQQNMGSFFDSGSKDELSVSMESIKSEGKKKKESQAKIKREKEKKIAKKKNVLIPSSSLENLDDYFGRQKQYATSSYQTPTSKKQVSSDATPSLRKSTSKGKDVDVERSFEEEKWATVRHRSASPSVVRSLLSGSSNESLFSYRSRSVSPDPTKYYRAYLRMVKCGAVRKLCNKFESWEDLLSVSSDKDFWLPPPPRRFASDPELTRDLLKRFGTDPTKVTIRGQEVGDVRWLRTKFEKDFRQTRGRSRFRRTRSPFGRNPLTVADRFMPRINVISKTAELQMHSQQKGKQKDPEPSRSHDLVASPEGYRSLIDYTKDHGGYYYTGEVEKLRRKFERLQAAERLSILGQMFTSTPDVNELRNIAPYLECSWVAHRHPGVTKTSPTPESQHRKKSPEPAKKIQTKPRPRSSSPPRPKQPSSILKPSYPYPDRTPYADQKFDPSIHRPKYRYQPERESDRRYKRADPDWWRHWNKPTVTFKESVSFKDEPEVRDLSPDSPRKYVESEVTIHYKTPVRSETKAMLSEEELARRQAESMKRIYKEERRRKYLQELQDMNSRRHTDNFTPSQKSPISLNRYDDFPVDFPSYYSSKGRDFITDPMLVARGLYDFVGRRPRELAFRRGDIIFIIRKLDKNWCEGELNGVVGLFPLSYVEVIPYNEINLRFGRARAKYDFIPQTSMELSARKGDMITLIRKIDENWFEGRIGERTGIIPASYCHILAMPQANRAPARLDKPTKPIAAPAAHSLIHDGSSLSSKHYYTPHLSGPNSPGRSTASSASANIQDGHTSADTLIDEALMQLDEEFDLKRSASKHATQPLSVRINPRPEPALYQVLFNHVPNNDDELELIQGETVTVVEKCGDGWYIGSKTSDGKLGIFPGTHVRRISSEFV